MQVFGYRLALNIIEYYDPLRELEHIHRRTPDVRPGASSLIRQAHHKVSKRTNQPVLINSFIT